MGFLLPHQAPPTTRLSLAHGGCVRIDAEWKEEPRAQKDARWIKQIYIAGKKQTGDGQMNYLVGMERRAGKASFIESRLKT